MRIESSFKIWRQISASSTGTGSTTAEVKLLWRKLHGGNGNNNVQKRVCASIERGG